MRARAGVGLLLLGLCSNCAPHGATVTLQHAALPSRFGAEPAGKSVGTMRFADWFQSEVLNQLIGEALTSNHDLQIALQRVEIARAGARAATGLLLPQVSLGLEAGLHRWARYTAEGAGNASTEIAPGQRMPNPVGDLSFGAQLSWEADLWGKLRAGSRSAMARYLATFEGVRLVRTQLIAEVASAYFELLALDHVSEVLRQFVTRQQEAVTVVRLQKQAGRANELAVQQFEAQLTETQALEREAAQQTLETENRLNLLLARYPRPIARDKQALFAPLPALSSGLPSDLLRNRPDLREAELQVRAADFDVEAARAAFLPSFNITANVAFEAFNPAYLLRVPESLSASLLGGLFAPIVNRSALEAQFAGSRATQITALYDYQRVILAAYVEVVNALASTRHVEQILALKQAQKAALSRSVETADSLYRAGKAGYLEVLTAQQASLRVELELIETFRKRRLASVLVYRALGGGSR